MNKYIAYSFNLPHNNSYVSFMRNNSVIIKIMINKNRVIFRRNRIDEMHIINNPNLFQLRFDNDFFYIFINQTLIKKTPKFDYDKINNGFTKLNAYKLAICYPIGLSFNHDEEKFDNLRIMINIIKEYQDVQICFLNLDNKKMPIFDSIVDKYRFDYIYVNANGEEYFNLGFARNMYRHIACSDRIMFSDIDIPITIQQIDRYLQLDADIVKPYRKVYNTTKQEKEQYKMNQLDIKKLKEPQYHFSISGGLVIFKRNTIDSLGGYEEYRYYGYEDRAMDVKILYRKMNVEYIDENLIHLFHNHSHKCTNPKKKILAQFHKRYYNCMFNRECINNIHENCEHNLKYIDKIIDIHKRENGNLNIFKIKPNTINFKTYNKSDNSGSIMTRSSSNIVR